MVTNPTAHAQVVLKAVGLSRLRPPGNVAKLPKPFSRKIKGYSPNNFKHRRGRLESRFPTQHRTGHWLAASVGTQGGLMTST